MIAVILAIHFRSVLAAVLALSPTVMSAAVLLLTMQLLEIRLNLVNSVMVPLLLGINVDYGIFAVVAARRSSASLPAACSALLTCAATTAVGCGTLALASVPAVQSLGVLIVAGIAGCLLGTLGLTLPGLLWRRAAATNDAAAATS